MQNAFWQGGSIKGQVFCTNGNESADIETENEFEVVLIPEN